MDHLTRTKLWSNIALTGFVVFLLALYFGVFGPVTTTTMGAVHGPVMLALLSIHFALERKVLVASGEKAFRVRAMTILVYATAAFALGAFCVSFLV